MLKKIKNFGFILMFIFISSNLFSTKLFYLSTEKTFSSTENKRVKLESGYEIRSLKVRVYKIKNPGAFYLSQSNFHRPVISERDFRKNTFDVSQSFLYYFKSGMRQWFRSVIPRENRSNSLDIVPELKGQYAYKPNLGEVVKPLKSTRFELLSDFYYQIPSFNQNWNYNYIMFNQLKAGLYLVEAVYKNQVGYTVLNVSDFGFILKKSNSKLLVYAVDNESGQPQKDVKLTIYNENKKVIKTAFTDSKGMSSQKITNNEIFVLGESKNKTFSFYDPQFYPINFSHLKVYMYSERPVYRGGDKVQFKGIMRNYKNDKYQIIRKNNIEVQIISSRGQVVKEMTLSSNENGSFNGSFNLSDKANAGRYLIVADIDGKKYEAEFKVEYYQKPEFEVVVKPNKRVVISGDDFIAKINARYYFGDPVKNAKLKYSVYKSQFISKAFENSQDKDFYLSEQEFNYSKMELVKTAEEELSSNGTLDINIETKKDLQAYYYKVKVQVMDASGVAISGGTSVKVVPAAYQIGISTDKFVYIKGENIQVEIKTKDFANKPISSKLDLVVSSEMKNGDIYTFIDKEIKTNHKGETSIQFKASQAGFVKIIAEGKDAQGNLTRTEKYIWIGQDGAAYNYKGGMVKLVLDKKYYKIGDEVKLLVLSPIPNANYLFTLEGDSLYARGVKKFKQNNSLIKFKIKDRYMPNVYATISFMFKNQYYTNTIKISVPAISKYLKIKVTPLKKKYKPGEDGKVKIKVTDYKGKPIRNSELSVAVVDEAIYGISEEIAINIKKYFYSFRRNNVRTWSSIGFRFYGYSEIIKEQIANKRFRHPNGLAAFKPGETKERKDFRDTILWLPSVKTNNKGEAIINIKFPDNITKWRITAVGITGDTKVGMSKGHVITKQDFFIKLAYPASLNERDNAHFYSTIHNYTKKKLKVKTFLKAKNLKIFGNKQKVEIEPGSSKVVKWKIKPIKMGAASITLTSLAGKYSDKITKNLKVYPHSIQQVLSRNQFVMEGNNDLFFDLPTNIKKESIQFNVNVSYGYFSTISAALPYLINYPYGCVEQTTSSFLPNLIAIKAFRKYGISMPGYEKKLPEIMSLGLNKLYGYQQNDGSWGWFNESRPDVFMTSYVMYALTLTKKLGYKIDQKRFNRGLSVLKKHMGNESKYAAKLFALYVLSMNGKTFPSIIEKMDGQNFDNYSLALLALTLKNSNKIEKAKQVIETLKKNAQSEKDFMYWGVKNTHHWYKDSVETTAWVLKAINSISYNDEVSSKAISWLMMQKQGNIWKSTRDTSAVIMTLTDFIGNKPFKEGKKLDVTFNGKDMGTVHYKKKNFNSVISFKYNEIKNLLKKQNNRFRVFNMDEGEKVFISMSMHYYTANKEIKANANGLNIQRQYYELDQSKDGDKITYSIGGEVSTLKKGTQYLVKITVNPDKDYQHLLIEDYYPGGAPPVKDFLIYNINGLSRQNAPDFIDYREEKVAFFIDNLNNRKELYYVVGSIFEGSYKTVPAQGYLMYFPNIRGNSNENSLKIEE